MMQTWSGAVARALVSGPAASLASAAVLALRGRKENHSAVAPLNAPSHIVWGDESLRENRPSVKHTLTGSLLHLGSGMLWATVFEKLRGNRAAPASAGAVLRSAAEATAIAAVVDLVLVPKRFTPGFERRLSTRSLWMVYAGLGAGMAAAGWWLAQRRR